MAKHPDLSEHLSQQIKPYVDVGIVKLVEFVVLPEACKQMVRTNSDEIVVVDNNGNPIGMVTDEDVLKKTSEALVNPSNTTLGDIMTFPVITINENKKLSEALDKMRQFKLRKLVVLSDERKIVGILYKDTIIDLMKKHLAIREEKRSSFRSIIWNLGIVLQFAGVLMFVPAILATVLWETVPATGIYLMSTVLFVTGFFMNSYGDRYPLKLRDAAILVFASFLILVLFGTIPHVLVVPFDTEKPLEHFARSFFESSAGFTTGGLTTINTPEDLPQSFTFYRSYTQFVGGLSFIYLIVTAFYPENKLHSMRSFISGRVPQLKELFITITILFTIYLTIIALLLFYFGERNLIDDFALAMNAVSTGGWLPNSQILVDLTLPEYIVLMFGMLVGALPFGFHYAFVRTKFRSVQINQEVAVYFVLLIIASGIIVFSMDVDPIDAVFNTISGSSNTGFQTIDLKNLNPIPFVVFVVIMIIGGCGFSTAGGMKLFRLIKFSKIKNLIIRKKLSQSDKNHIITASILVVLFPLIPYFVATHMESMGYDFENSYFDALSALTTTGLNMDTDYENLEPSLLTLFAFLMIFGRVEIILIVYMVVPRLIP